MKIEFSRDDENMKVFLKALASRRREVRTEALWALAEWLLPALEPVLLQEPVLTNLFRDYVVAEGEPTSIPIDRWRNYTDQQYITVWQQGVTGGLPSNMLYMPTDEVRVRPIMTETAIHWNRNQLKVNGAEFIARSVEMLMQQLLVADNATAMNMIAMTLARTPGQVYRASVDGYFTLDDFNNLITIAKEMYLSWAGGSTSRPVSGYTDLYMSIRAIGDIRKMAYNPVNTDGPPIDGGIPNGIPAPNEMRASIYSATGDYGFFGTVVHELPEFGIGNQFNDFFAEAIGNTPIAKFDEDPATGTPFNPEKDEIILGIDLSVPSMFNVVESYQDSMNTSRTLILEPDDQYVGRSGNMGLWGGRQQGKVILDDRAFVGMVKTKKA